MMMLGDVLCYIPISFDFIKIDTKDTYIQLGTDRFFLSGIETFESFEFKSNKRGGESGKIKFSKMFGDYKIGDSVKFVLEGKSAFNGIIELIDNYGTEINIIPSWAMLDFTFITDTLQFESTLPVIEIVQSLKQKIIQQGINYSDKNVIIPKEYLITSTMAGKSLRAILDDCEKELPNSYCYGVDSNNNFYFKQFSEYPEKVLSWHLGHFSESTYTADYSNIVSQYIVKIKNSLTGAYNVLKDIIGDSINYPATAWTDIVGKKTGVFEYNFPAEAGDALDLAYERLKKQVATEKLTLKTLNYKAVEINPNEALQIVEKPTENIYEDFTINFSNEKTISNNISGGELVKIGKDIGYSRKTGNKSGMLDFSIQPNYIDLCNRSLDIYKIVVYYNSSRSFEKFVIRDNKKQFILYGNAGVLEVNIKNFNKRKLVLRLLDIKNKVSYYRMRCYFTQGSRKINMNVRNIKYAYKSGLLNVDVELAKINANLTGYIFDQNLKLKNLENLLTN